MSKSGKLGKLVEKLTGSEQAEQGSNEAEGTNEVSKGIGDVENASEDECMSETERAAMILGTAMLERVGVPEGVSPIAVVMTLLKRMEEDSGNKKRTSSGTKLPKPMRGGLSEVSDIDYENMSSADFQKLKKQLKKAGMDGRKVRLG